MAARRGDALIVGTARCNECQLLWTELGWKLHQPEEIGIDSFQADRGPERASKTQILAALFVREHGLIMCPDNQGHFSHDGRFATLPDVVNHYNIHLNLGLNDREKQDLVEDQKSL